MPETVNIHEAKTNLSKLIVKVGMGEEVVIAKNGKPVARLLPVQEASKLPPLGDLEGKIWMSEDFNDSLPDEYLGLD